MARQMVTRQSRDDIKLNQLSGLFLGTWHYLSCCRIAARVIVSVVTRFVNISRGHFTSDNFGDNISHNRFSFEIANTSQKNNHLNLLSYKIIFLRNKRCATVWKEVMHFPGI